MVGLAEQSELRRAPLRVLLVEDSEDDALLLLRELRRGGYEPEYERVDTPEAMERALAGSVWDVIFSDYRMPRFGAPEALKMWHASGLETPFIVVSGKIGEDVAARMIKAGAYDYVMKDNLTRLRVIVERSLQEARERRDLRRAGRELQRRDAILEAVRFAAERFLSEAVGWEQSVRAVLRRLGEATGASRVYVFENFMGEDDELWGRQRYEWVTKGISAQMDNPLMQALPYRAAGFGRWVELLGRGEPVHGHTREFPESEQPEAREQGILSIVVVPIFVEGRWWGFIGFDECFEEREWSTAEVGALGAAAGTLGAAIRRRRIEEELRGSEERYRAVIEQATDGIYLLDAETRRILETNPSFQKMLGYATDELRGMEVYDFVAHPRENIDSTISRTLAQRRRLVGERKYRRKDGSLIDVEVGVSVFSYAGKEVIGTIVRDVTERKKNEEALRASEAELRALFEAMTDAMFVLDGEGRYLKIAPRDPSLLYKPPAELLGKTVQEVFPPEQADEFLGNIQRALKTGRTVNFEYGLQMDDQTMWFDCSISPMLEDSVVWVARDVTERKRSEEALKEGEEHYRAVIEQATDGIYLLDFDTRRLLETNPSFQTMLGYTEEELRRMTLYDVVDADRESVDANLRRVLERKRYFIGERKYRRKDGSLLDVEVSVSVISYGGKEATCTIVRDITERKRAEEALARSENRLRTIIETEPECVKVLGMDGSLLEMNPAGLSMIEADSLEQVRGNPVYEYIVPEHRTDFVALTERVLHGGSGMLEFELVGLKGTSRWLETHAVPLRDARGEITGLLAITRDITERKKNEEALRQSERLYRAVIEQATENIYLVDIKTRRIVESNPAFRETLGYTEEELRRMTLYDVIAADRESIDANVRRVLELKNPFVGQRQYRRKDGSLVDVEVSASTILHNGRETLCVVAHDVTERARAQELLEERLAILSRVATRLTLDLPVQDTLDAVAESVVNAGTAVSCAVILVDEVTGLLHIEGSHGLPEEFKAGIEAIWRDSSVRSPTIEAIRTRRPTLDSHMRQRMLEDPLYAPVHSSVREVAWDTVFIVPLVSRGRTLGVLNLGYPEGQQPGEDERVFLGAVADQAAVAVENTRLFAEARGKAALEERQHLARELHDSVSQALYGIALGAKTARTLLDQNPDRAVDPLDYVLSLADAGMAEMRALIFELRPESLETEGLVAALEKQAAALRARHEIEVEATLCDEPESSLSAKEAVYRIAQEALHNTVKHARATNVEINMVCNSEQVTLEISDDGLGFDARGDFPGHLGLRSMRERASRLGGTLEIESAPGRGTQIYARIPV